MRLLDASFRRMPSRVLPRPTVPVGSVPRKFPSIRFWLLSTWIPSPPKRLITSPRTVLDPAVIVRPVTPIPALAPFSSMSRIALSPTASVLGLAPGWV